jgi:hypothetical protein
LTSVRLIEAGHYRAAVDVAVVAVSSVFQSGGLVPRR